MSNYNSGRRFKFRIPAFKARILRHETRNEEVKRIFLNSLSHSISPYFKVPNNNKRVGSSLLDHKYEKFCVYAQHDKLNPTKKYSLKGVHDEEDENMQIKLAACQRFALRYNRVTNFSNLYGGQLTDAADEICDLTRSDIKTSNHLASSEMSYLPTTSVTDSILRMSRKCSLANACKQYPNITNQSTLSKYNHLFGLKPIVEQIEGRSVRKNALTDSKCPSYKET